jgi:myo-inositol-1(or 4)-monophosphatase
MTSASLAATSLDELADVAQEAARAGAEAAMAWWPRLERLAIREKAAPDDLVSEADHDAEAAIRAVLQRLRPNDGVLGEESGATRGASGVRWVVDPIDGTMSYLYGRPDWAVSVAGVRVLDGEVLTGVVVEPAIGRVTHAGAGGGTWSNGARGRCRPTGELRRALVEVNLGRPAQRGHAGQLMDALVPHVRDVRRGGSAADALAQVATGRADAYWGPGLKSWDGSAGILLVKEAGGTIGDLSGSSDAEWPGSGDALGSAPRLFEPLRALLRDVYDPRSRRARSSP